MLLFMPLSYSFIHSSNILGPFNLWCILAELIQTGKRQSNFFEELLVFLGEGDRKMRQKQTAASEIGATTELVPRYYSPGMGVSQRLHPGWGGSIPSKLLTGPLGSVLPTPLTSVLLPHVFTFGSQGSLTHSCPCHRAFAPAVSTAQFSSRNPCPDLALCLPIRETFPDGPAHSLHIHKYHIILSSLSSQHFS